MKPVVVMINLKLETETQRLVSDGDGRTMRSSVLPLVVLFLDEPLSMAQRHLMVFE